MGDAVIVGKEDKEAVEAEDDDEDNDEGMEEMEIKGEMEMKENRPAAACCGLQMQIQKWPFERHGRRQWRRRRKRL